MGGVLHREAEGVTPGAEYEVSIGLEAGKPLHIQKGVRRAERVCQGINRSRSRLCIALNAKVRSSDSVLWAAELSKVTKRRGTTKAKIQEN